MKKILLILLIGLLLLLAVGAGTTQGLRMLVAAADWILPAEIEVSHMTGSLLGPLDIEGVHYRDAAVDVRVDTLGLDWRPSALFRANVHVRHLRASGIDVRVLKAPQEKSAAPVALQPLPVAVAVDDLTLTDISVLGYGAAEPVRIERLHVAITGDDASLQVQAFTLDTEQFAARIQGALPLDAQQEGSITTDWWLQLQDAPRLVGTGTLQGNVRRLQLEQDISGPGRVTLRATLEDVLEQLRWNATADIDAFDLRVLQPQGPERVLGASLVGSGGLDAFNVEGKAQLTDPSYGAFDADLQLTRSPGRWQLQRLDLRNPQWQGLLRINGEYGAGGELTGKAAWSDFAWQLSQQQTLRSDSGEISVEGRLDAYRFKGNALLESTGYPLLTVNTEGVGNLQKIELKSLRGESTQGAFDTTGMLAWAPGLEWNIQAGVSEFDPAFFVPGRPGRLSFRLQSEGSQQAQGLQGRILLDEVAGTLQGQNVSGKASAKFSGERLEIEDSNFVIGATRLSASGQLEQEWNIRWDAVVPDLGLLQPGTRGALSGRGQFTGPRDTPRFAATLRGSKLKLPGFRLQALQADIDVDLGDQQASKIDIKGDGLEVSGRPPASVTLTADGKRSAHVIRFALQQDKTQLAGNINARLDASTWSGALEDLRARLSDTQTWTLQQPAKFSVEQSRAALNPMCMVQTDARLCVEGNWQPADWTASLDGENLPLALLQPWLEQDIALEGAAGMQLRARSERGALRATAKLELAPGRITLDDGEETLQLLQFGPSHISARMQDNVLEADLELPLQDNGKVSGELRLANVVSKAGWFSGGTTVASAIQLHFIDNGLISVFVPGISTAKGQVDGDLSVRGTLANPLFDGTATLKDAEVSLPQLGIRLTDTNMKISGDGNTLALQGSVNSGEGMASIQGQLVFARGGLTAMDLALGGENVQLVNIPEAMLFASPDLKLALRDKRIDITGTVRVPEAVIRLREVQSVARESGDTVIVQQEVAAAKAKAKAKAGKYQIVSRVTLVLEDKVSFSGFGLNGNIKGKLDILEDPGKVTRGQGELNIIDGTYKLYGQKLDIEKGRLVFAGGPIVNPGLELRVVRKSGDVLAGMRVSGSAESPALNLFSEPSMEQSEVLSYLLLGVPTNKASGAQGAALSGAAASLGLTGGDALARKLGNAFGIEEVRIDSGDTLEESSLVLGKYLSPRMYISYAVGLFDQTNSVRIRYTLSRRWSVQTEAGVTSGADLLYSLEND